MMEAAVEYCNSENCVGPRLYAGERFCPWCGQFCCRCELSLEEKDGGTWRSLPGREVSEESHRELRLRVDLLESVPGLALAPGAVSCSVPWLTVVEAEEPQALECGHPVFLAISLHTEHVQGRVAEKKVSAKISVCLRKGNEASCITRDIEVSLLLAAHPRIQCALPAGSVLDSPEAGAEVRIPFWLLGEGVDFVVDGLSVEGVAEEKARVYPVQGWPNRGVIVASAGINSEGSGAYMLELSSAYVSSLAQECKIVVACAYHYVDASGATVRPEASKLSVEICLRTRPKLQVAPFDNELYVWDVVVSDRRPDPLVFELTNCAAAESELLVYGWQLRPLEMLGQDALRFGPGLLYAVSDTGSELPLKLTGERSEKLEFAWPDLPAGRYTVEIIFVTNEGVNGARFEHRYTVQMCASEASECTGGVLAVDFGTSASCVSVFVPGGSQMVPVDDESGGDPDCARSVLEYQTYDDCYYDANGMPCRSEDIINFGYLAWESSFARPISTIRNPKKLVREKAVFEVTPSINHQKAPKLIPVAEAVKHVYRILASKAKQAVVSGELSALVSRDSYKFVHFVITHPSRFRRDQLGILQVGARAAFSEVFGADFSEGHCTLGTIQEPVAAAMYFLQDEAIHRAMFDRADAGGDKLVYSLVVFDCGGGTTDLSLLRVDCTRHRLDSIPCPNSVKRASRDRKLHHYWVSAVRRAVQDLWAESNACAEGVNSSGTALSEQLSSALSQEKAAPFWLDESISSWKQASERYPGVLPKEVTKSLDSITFSPVELATEVLRALGDYAANRFHYSVKLTLEGSWGEPCFGGEDMTEVVRQRVVDLVNERLPKISGFEDGTWYLRDRVKSDGCQALSQTELEGARTNDSILSYWAEYIKCRGTQAGFKFPQSSSDYLTSSTGDVHSVALMQLKFSNKNFPGMMKEEHILDILQGDCPSREDIQRALASQVYDAVYLVDELMNSCGDKSMRAPDMILLTGRASRWPQIRQTLEEQYPQDHTIVFQPAQGLKECVVAGAARWGVSSGGSLEDPGVTVSVGNPEGMTTSRIGIRGQRDFVQVISANERFREGKASGTIKWLFKAGEQRITVCENASLEDLLFVDGRSNASVGECGVCTFHVPREGAGCIHIDIMEDMTLRVTAQLSEGEPWSETCELSNGWR